MSSFIITCVSFATSPRLHGICCSHICTCGLITCVSHINTISPLGCHSITKTTQGPFNSKLWLLLPKSFSHNLQISAHSSLLKVIICAIEVGGLTNTIARHSFTSKWLTLQINRGLTLIPLERIFGWIEGINSLTKKSMNSQTLDKRG